MEKYQILRDQANQRCKYLISIDENNLILMAILLYPPFKASFLTNLARLEIAKLIQSGQTTSVTMNKKIMKQTLAHVFYIFNLRCSVQAASLNNTELIEIVYHVKTTNSRFNFVYPYYKHEGTDINLGNISNGNRNTIFIIDD